MLPKDKHIKQYWEGIHKMTATLILTVVIIIVCVILLKYLGR